MNKNEVYFYKNNNIEIIVGKGLIDFPYHTHNSYLLGKITSGKLLMDLNKEHYEMREGMMFIVPSNIRISMKHQDFFSYTILCFSGIMAEELCKNKPMALVFEDKQNIFEGLITSYKKTKDEEAVLQSVKKAFMIGKNIDYLTQKHSEIIEQALAYMDTHTEDKCSVEEIANKLYVSKYYFSKLFEREMGITPKKYMIQNKLRRVKQKLLEESRETDIAINMEYAAQSHMCSVFKRYMGISIHDYKKKLKIIE